MLFRSKTSSRSEEHYEDSCEDEDAEMAMLARRYKRLTFQRDERMGRRSFKRDQFRNEPSRNNQITCYGCKQPRHLRSECPLNKEGKKDKDKKKKKAMVATWPDSDPSSSESEPKMDIKANLALWPSMMMRYVLMTLMILINYKMSMNACLMILKNLGIDVKTTRKSLYFNF